MNFDWAMRLDQVWDEAETDVEELHQEHREAFARTLESMSHAPRDGSPLGLVFIGSGGTGKTHLLGAFRREAARQRASFVMVDMTDVHEFWETVLQGYLDSLQQPVNGRTPQFQCVIENVIERLGPASRSPRF